MDYIAFFVAVIAIAFLLAEILRWLPRRWFDDDDDH